MVVHSPAKFEVSRPAEDTGGAGGNTGTGGAVGGTNTTGATGAQSSIPPSVAAAAASAAAANTGGEADLLGNLASGTWEGHAPPPGAPTKVSIEVDIHSANEEEDRFANVNTRRGRGRSTTGAADATDGVPAAGTSSSTHPQLNPFTPEWFAQIIGAAATAAATAVANSPRQQAVPPPAPSNPAAPRRLNERKVPDFWEDKPDFWFRIFDAHLAHFGPTEQQSFDTLLPLLTHAARAVVHSVIGAPGLAPYTRARDALLRHFGQTPRQKARDFREARSMGDKLPTEFLDHLEALLPDVKALFEVALLDALTANARVAALQHSGVRAMAIAADAVVQENRAAQACDRTTAAVNSMSLMDRDLESPSACPTPLSPAPVVAAVGRASHPPRDSLCQNHKRWGRETYKCLAPVSCKMRTVLKPRPSPSSSTTASGNGKAGGH